MLGPTLFTQTFAAFIGPQADWHLPGAPYLLSTLLLLIGAVTAWRATKGLDRSGVVGLCPARRCSMMQVQLALRTEQ